jgi:hypothetical protein
MILLIEASLKVARANSFLAAARITSFFSCGKLLNVDVGIAILLS